MRTAFLLVLALAICLLIALRPSRDPNIRPASLQSETPPIEAPNSSSPLPPVARAPRLGSVANPPDKIALAHNIIEERDRLIAFLHTRTHGFLTHAEKQELRRIQSEAEEQLRTLVTSAQRAELEKREFKDTRLARQIAQSFACTNDELAAISAYETSRLQDFNSNIGRKHGVYTVDQLSATYSLEGLQKYEDAWQRKLRLALGEKRRDDYLRFRDRDYLEALNFAARYELDPSIAGALLELREQRKEERFQVISKHTPREEIEPILEQQLQSYRGRIEQLLGPERAANYIAEASDTWWLQSH